MVRRLFWHHALSVVVNSTNNVLQSTQLFAKKLTPRKEPNSIKAKQESLGPTQLHLLKARAKTKRSMKRQKRKLATGGPRARPSVRRCVRVRTQTLHRHQQSKTQTSSSVRVAVARSTRTLPNATSHGARKARQRQITEQITKKALPKKTKYDPRKVMKK